MADWSGNYTQYEWGYPIYSCDYSDDGNYFAISSYQGEILIYNCSDENITLVETNKKRSMS